jgi:hypothetical protein
LQFAADTVAASEVAEANGELRFVIPGDCLLYPDDIHKALQSMGMRPMKVSIAKGTPQANAAPPQRKTASEDEAAERALSHPDVKRFREAFPDAHVRAVRNLKE